MRDVQGRVGDGHVAGAPARPGRLIQRPGRRRRDRRIARDILLGGSRVSQPYPAELGDAARALLDRRADDLDAATLYVMSPSMSEVVIAAAQTLMLDDLALLSPDDLPSPTGLIMLPFPLMVRTVGGGLGDDRGEGGVPRVLLPGLWRSLRH